MAAVLEAVILASVLHTTSVLMGTRLGRLLALLSLLLVRWPVLTCDKVSYVYMRSNMLGSNLRLAANGAVLLKVTKSCQYFLRTCPVALCEFCMTNALASCMEKISILSLCLLFIPFPVHLQMHAHVLEQYRS